MQLCNPLIHRPFAKYQVRLRIDVIIHEWNCPLQMAGSHIARLTSRDECTFVLPQADPKTSSGGNTMSHLLIIHSDYALLPLWLFSTHVGNVTNRRPWDWIWGVSVTLWGVSLVSLNRQGVKQTYMRAALWNYAKGIRLSHSRSLFTMIILVFMLSSTLQSIIILLSKHLKVDTLKLKGLFTNFFSIVQISYFG